MSTPATTQSKAREGLAKASEVAEYLGTSCSQLAKLRWERRGPTYIRMPGGRSVRYRWSDVEAWVEAGTRQSAR